MTAETKTYRVEPDITVVEVSGRLNLGNLLQPVESAIRGLITSGARKLVIDVSRLNSIDSAGIGMLISCGVQLNQLGGQARLAGAHGQVAKVFELVHVHRIIPLDADLALACASFSAGGAASQ